MPLKATIVYVSLPATPNAGYEVEEIFIVKELPFVPHAGMLIKVTEDGDYLKVQSVMLDLNQDGEGLVVNMHEPGEGSFIQTFESMTEQGWQRLG